MKKNIIIFCVVFITLSLTVFSVISWNNSETDQLETPVSDNIASKELVVDKLEKRIFTDFIYNVGPSFIYDVGPRFSAIKKGDVNKAKSIDAFFNKEQLQRIISLKSVSVIIIIDDKQSDIREIGYKNELTSAQLKLLQSSDYSTNFLIRTEYQQKNNETGELEDSYSTPHLTIVPEKQAIYLEGKDAFMKFLNENSENARANVEPEKLKPAKLFFTITKNGAIENIKLDRTSGYPLVDKIMIELIAKAPGKWEPAENSKGEKVDQELVVSFGLMGC